MDTHKNTKAFDKAVNFLAEIAALGADILSEVFDVATGRAFEKDSQKMQLVNHFADRFMADRAFQENNPGLARFIINSSNPVSTNAFNSTGLSDSGIQEILLAAKSKADKQYPKIAVVRPREKPATVSYCGLNP